VKLSILVFITIMAAVSVGVAQADNSFDMKQLSGWWAESYNTDVTCSADNLKVKHELSADGKRLSLKFDRRWQTELGEMDHVEATVLSSTERTLVIQYDGESRSRPDGKLQEWELSIVAPGVYRWRETSWPTGNVNPVVGIRCSE